MIKRPSLFVLLCILLAGAAGCSKRHHIEVQSDTCWAGTVNGDQHIDGCGNSSYRVLGGLRCVAVHRTTSGGSLRVRIDEHEWVSTVNQFGDVQACN